MKYLYEYSDILNTPYEAFIVDSLTADLPIRPHWHHYAEMLYMLEGSMLTTVNEKDYYMSRGDVIFFYQGDIHAMFVTPDERVRFACIKFDTNRLTVNANYTPRLTIMLNAARGQDARVFFTAEESAEHELGDCFTGCVKEMAERELGFDVAVHARLCTFMTRIMRLWQREGVDFTNVSGYVSEEELSLQNILEYIDLHLDENLKVEELAARCSMSYSHFARSFKELYGRSCKEHLELLKVEKAEEMLKFTDYSLNDISQELGFSDCSHFIRVFKRLKGVTPGSLRR